MLIQVAAKNTKGSSEAVAAAFQAVNRGGPFGTAVRDDLKGLVIPAGKDRGRAEGADKAEHVLKNADLAMGLAGSSLARDLLIAIGDALEKFQPLTGGKSDPGDMEANRAGIALGVAIERGKVDLTRFTMGDIPQ